MKLSARNSYKGRITKITEGPISTEVSLALAPGMEIVSVITTNSAKRLEIEVGDEAYAIVKADSVIIGTE